MAAPESLIKKIITKIEEYASNKAKLNGNEFQESTERILHYYSIDLNATHEGYPLIYYIAERNCPEALRAFIKVDKERKKAHAATPQKTSTPNIFSRFFSQPTPPPYITFDLHKKFPNPHNRNKMQTALEYAEENNCSDFLEELRKLVPASFSQPQEQLGESPEYDHTTHSLLEEEWNRLVSQYNDKQIIRGTFITKIIKLMKQNLSTDLTGKDGDTVFQWILYLGDKDLIILAWKSNIESFLKKKIDVENFVSKTKKLIEAGVDMHLTSEQGNTALHAALHLEDKSTRVRFVQYLLWKNRLSHNTEKKEAFVNALNPEGKSALFIAMEMNDGEIIRKLEENGAIVPELPSAEIYAQAFFEEEEAASFFQPQEQLGESPECDHTTHSPLEKEWNRLVSEYNNNNINKDFFISEIKRMMEQKLSTDLTGKDGYTVLEWIIYLEDKNLIMWVWQNNIESFLKKEIIERQLSLPVGDN